MVGYVKTGIDGLDAMLNGGIPEGDQVIIEGGPGSGKTLISFEFLYRNALNGATGIFFSLDEEPERVIRNAKAAFYELDRIDEMIESGKMLVYPDPYYTTSGTQYELGKLLSAIESKIEESNAKCVVIDSMAMLALMAPEPARFRRAIVEIITSLRKHGVISLFTEEMKSPERNRLEFSPEHFVFDGIITMYQTGEDFKRMPAIEVIKMRGTSHSMITTPYEITPSGFKITAAENIANYD